MASALYTLAASVGIHNMQRGIGPLYNRFLSHYAPRPLLRRDLLEEIGAPFSEQGNRSLRRLHAALDEIEQNDELLRLSHFLVDDLCKLPERLSHDEYEAMTPVSAMKEADLYSFILLLACLEPSFNRLRALGMPDVHFRETALDCARRQMKKFCETGVGRVADFPWDKGYYTAALFRVGRFLFKLERMWHPVVVYRRGNETMAFCNEPCLVRTDGQLDGVNGYHDPSAFAAEYSDNGDTVTGHPIHPAGRILPSPVSLNRHEWAMVLKPDDITLGLHIPSGPGYDETHLRDNCAEAYAFFTRWFPRKKVKAFSNESWLNDPHIPALAGSTCRIARMQQQMYLFPVLSGDEMGMQELFPQGLTEPGQGTTRLQKAAAEYVLGGGRLTTCGMFILPEDIPRLGAGPYAETEAYEQEYQIIRRYLCTK